MNRLMSTVGVLIAGVAVLGRAQGSATNAAEKADVAVKPASSGLKLDGGADFRLRDELKHEMPGTGVTAKKFENLLRLRSRLWGSASYEDYTLYGRIANEFRVYTARSGKNKAGMSTYDFPDELYFDSLYLDVKNLVEDRLDVRIGRQELKYGEGRIISDASPGDGSRSS